MPPLSDLLTPEDLRNYDREYPLWLDGLLSGSCLHCHGTGGSDGGCESCFGTGIDQTMTLPILEDE